VFLFIALALALSFEFVNGFHDTANAVATVIYTNTLRPYVAVIWSGIWNFIGVLTSTGAVAYGIVALLPVELVINVGSGAGFAMVFALLLSAIIWNLGTWYLGLPASSSHTLIGSIMGVGLANSFLRPGHAFGEGVNWGQAKNIGLSLIISPVIGFCCAALLLLLAKALIKRPDLFAAPEKGKAPPPWIRGLLVLTCTGVSFAHGSNDGQKGMGLLMLIMIGVVPGAFALKMNTDEAVIHRIAGESATITTALRRSAAEAANAPDPVAEVSAYLAEGSATAPTPFTAIAELNESIARKLDHVTSFSQLPEADRRSTRTAVYLVGKSMDKLIKTKQVSDPLNAKRFADYKSDLEGLTQYIPIWVKIAVHGAGTRNHDRVEADCRDRRRKDRQSSSHLRPGSFGRAGGDVHHRGGGPFRPAGQHHARPFFRGGRDHAGESFGFADEDVAQSFAGLGAHPAGLHFSRRHAFRGRLVHRPEDSVTRGDR